MPVVRGATAAVASNVKDRARRQQRHDVRERDAEYKAHASEEDDLAAEKQVARRPSLYATASQRIFSRQSEAKVLYEDIRCQIFVACLIAANFVVNIVEAQVGTNRRHKHTFKLLEWFFFVVFWVELLVNMYSSWFYRFWRDPFNLFDLMVVLLATLEFAILRIVGIRAGGLRELRMVRAFRVFRLFKRVKSLNKIVLSLARALPGMLEALFILFLITCIYAIVGYTFFHDWPCAKPFRKGPGSCADTIDGFGVPDGFPGIYRACGKHSSPGYGMRVVCRSTATFGHEYFGNFLKSMFTLFQVLTGESWSEVIGRALLEKSPFTAVYFVSFILINSVVMINVVVAVLLEKMVLDSDDDDQAASDATSRTPSSSDDGDDVDDKVRSRLDDDDDDRHYHQLWDTASTSYKDDDRRDDLKEALQKIEVMQAQLNQLTEALKLLSDRVPPEDDVVKTTSPPAQKAPPLQVEEN